MNTFLKLFLFFIFLFVSLFFTILQINKTSYHPTSITIDIASGQKDMYQVFYDTGFGYNEKESVIFNTSGLINQKAVFIIQGAKFKRFRIDPGSKKGVIKIKQICIENTNSRKCWLNHDLLSKFKFINCIHNQHLEDGSLVIESTGIDPYFECRDNLKGEINFILNQYKALSYVLALLLINILVSAILFYSDRIYNKIRRVIDSTSTSTTKLYKPQKIFLFISIIWGVLTIFVTPPFQVPDEPNHFKRACQIADGNFIPKTLNNQVGGFIPKSIIDFCNCYNSIPFHSEQKIKVEKIYNSLKIPLKSEKKSFVFFPNTGLYSPIPYIPQSLAITIGKIFNAPPLILLYLARLFNLFAWIILIFWAIKIIPFYKWLFFILALMPMSVFQASSVSADVLTNGIAFLFIALVFELAFVPSKSLRKIDLWGLIILLILLILSKYAYSLLIFLYFLIPVHKSGSIRKYILNAFPLFIIAGLTLLIGSLFVKHIYESINPTLNYYWNLQGISNIHVDLQFQFIITHIGLYFKTVMLSFWENKWFLFGSFIGNLGWLDTSLPQFYIIIAFSVLFLTALSEHHENLNISLKKKAVLLISLGSIIFVIFTLLYLSWTTVGKSLIEGMQGRYLIPVGPIFFTLFYNRKWKIPEIIVTYISVIFIIVSFLVMTTALINRYYC